MRSEAHHIADRAAPVQSGAGAESLFERKRHDRTAWYPLGHGDRALREEPLFAKLGEKYGKTSTQIILHWHMQAGNVVIPGSKNPEHIKANFDLFDFELTADKMAQIAAMNQNKRYYTSTPELLKKYAEMVPPVDEQK